MHNIMILASTLHIGGAEYVIANLARYLDRKRFKVTVCHLMERGQVGDEMLAEGIDVVGAERSAHRLMKYFSFRDLNRVIRDRGIELVHSHTTYALTDAALCKLFGGGRPKLINTFHYGNYPHVPRRYLMMERVFSRVADRLVAVGIEQRETICRTHRLDSSQIGTVINGVEMREQKPDPEWSRRLSDRGAVVIGTICTFIEQKGLPDLLSVAEVLCRERKDVLFVVVGDGWMRPSVEARCRELGLADRVLFTGWKPSAATTMLPLFDIFFQPSLWEAMSMVILEAMAMAKPVVATDVGDNRHVIEHGSTGFIVPPRDIGRMVESLRGLVDSAARRREFGDRSRERCRERYTVQAMVDNYERMYLDVLAGRPDRAAAESAVSSSNRTV